MFGKIFGQGKYMRNCLLSLLLTIWAIGIYAQDVVDNNYIKQYYSKVQLSSYFNYQNSFVRLRQDDQTPFSFKQDGWTLGFRSQFKKWGIGISLPLSLQKNKERPSSSFALKLQLFPNHFLVDFGFQRNKGFGQQEVLETTENFREDIKMTHLFFYPIYTISNQTYSLRSSFLMTDRQVQSSGSILVGLLSDFIRIKGDRPIFEQELDTPVKYTFSQNGISGGYAYTYVLSDHFFATGMAMTSLAFTKIAQEDQIKKSFGKFRFIPISDFRLATGYNTDQFFAGIQLRFHPRLVDFNELSMYQSSLSLQFTFGIRFQANSSIERMDGKLNDRLKRLKNRS